MSIVNHKIVLSPEVAVNVKKTVILPRCGFESVAVEPALVALYGRDGRSSDKSRGKGNLAEHLSMHSH